MRKYLPSRATAKAVASSIVCLAAYLVGVVPAQGGLGDVTVAQWLGAIVFLGGAYGITYGVSNTPAAKRGEDGAAADLIDVTILIGVVLLLFGVRFR